MISPLLDLPGAVPAPTHSPVGTTTDRATGTDMATDTATDTGAISPDAEVAWHHGDPMREQRLLASGEAVTDLSHRGLLIVTGQDRLPWLHSLTTQHLSELPPGVAVEALVLSPHGHVEHSLHLVDDGERTWISVEATSMRPASAPSTAEPVADWLRSMRFRKRVAVEDVSDQWAALGLVIAPDAALPEALSGALSGGVADAGSMVAGGPPSWQDPWPAIGEDTGVYTGAAPSEHPGWQRPWREIWLPRTELAATVAAAGPAGLSVAGSWASEALRVAAWRPRAGCENDHRTLPHEADWLRTGLHLTKGCYRGQETVARVYHLGKPPRRLVMLHLDGSEHDLPAAGDAVFEVGGERAVGHVTTAVRHHELGPIALAMVKRALAVEAPLRVRAPGASPDGGQAASQEVIVAP